MFNNLFFALKNRILNEMIDTLNTHPQFADKTKVVHKYPYFERIQFGLVLRNTGASQIRLAADNFIGQTFSHVALARAQNFPGYSIEWVREDALKVTAFIKDEDVSSQVGPTQRQFITAHTPIVAGFGNTDYADNFGQVQITINGQQVFADFVNGEKGIVLLPYAPNTGDVVLISYYYKTISPAGRYQVTFTEDTQFEVDSLLFIENEVVIENTTGTEVTATLANTAGVVPVTMELFLKSRNGGTPIKLVLGMDYTFNVTGSVITFLIPLLPNFRLEADYKYQGSTTGPFTFKPYQEVNSAIPGVIISIGRRAKKGDLQIVLVSKFREPMAQVYGGHWTMSLSVGVIAKDPMQMAEMSDLLVQDFWANKKNLLEFEGITMNSIEPTGETEEVYDSVSGDMYYETTVDMNIMTEWQKFVPYLWKTKDFFVDLERFPKTHDYYVTKEGTLVPPPIHIEIDKREVVKFPILGYERVV